MVKPLLSPVRGGEQRNAGRHAPVRSPERPEGWNGEGIVHAGFRRAGTQPGPCRGDRVVWAAGAARLPRRRPPGRRLPESEIYGDFFEVLGCDPRHRLLEARETSRHGAAAEGRRRRTSWAPLPLRHRHGFNQPVVRMTGGSGRPWACAEGGGRAPSRRSTSTLSAYLGALVPLFGATAERLRGRDADLHGDIVRATSLPARAWRRSREGSPRPSGGSPGRGRSASRRAAFPPVCGSRHTTDGPGAHLPIAAHARGDRRPGAAHRLRQRGEPPPLPEGRADRRATAARPALGASPGRIAPAAPRPQPLLATLRHRSGLSASGFTYHTPSEASRLRRAVHLREASTGAGACSCSPASPP